MKILKVIFFLFLASLFFFASFYVTINFLLEKEKAIPCPKIEGKKVNEARRILEKEGLFLEVMRYEKRKDIPERHIIYQNPKEGTYVKKGRKIYVVVSLGPKLFSCPDLLGIRLEEVESILKEKNLRVEKIIEVPSSQKGVVLAQIPSPNEEIMEGSGLKLFVGYERRYYLIPKINYENLDKIKEEMENKGLRYKILLERNQVYDIMPSIEISKEGILYPDEEITIKVKIKGI